MIVAIATRRLLILGDLGDERVGSEQQRRNAGGVSESCPHDLGRVDHASADEVAILALVGVVAVILPLHVPNAVDHDRTIGARILGDRFERILEGIFHDRRAHLLVSLEVEFLDRLLAAEQGHAAARDHALGEGSLHGTLGVVDEGLSLLHLRLGRSAHVDLGHTTGELRQPFLEFLTVVVAGGLRDLVADLCHTAVDRHLCPTTAHDGGVFRVDDHLLGPTEVGEFHAVERDAEVFEDRLAASEHGDITEHGLAAVAIAGSLYSHRLDDAAEFIDHQRRQRLTLDIFGDDHKWLARLTDRLEKRHEILSARNLLLVEEDGGIFELADLALGISHEVGREKAAVELHALDDVDRRFGLLALLNRDHAILADLEEGLGEDVADRRVVVARDRGDLHQLFLVLLVDRGGHRKDRLRHRLDSLVDAPRQRHRVGAGRDHLDPLAEDRLGKNGGGGRAVTGDIIGLAGGFLHELGAEILERIFEIDVFGDGDAVLGHLGRAPALVEHSVAAAGAERALHGTGEFGNAGEQRLASLVVEHHLFGHGRLLSTVERLEVTGLAAHPRDARKESNPRAMNGRAGIVL